MSIAMLSLTAVGGFVDAIGYTHIGNFYLSFMSGNTTRLGIALSSREYDIMLTGLAIVFLFTAGAFFGSLLASRTGKFCVSAVLAAEVLMLFASYVGVVATGNNKALFPIAVAMGMQNTVHHVIFGVDSGKTFITGAAFGAGHFLAQAVVGKDRFAKAGVHAATWLVFAAGVVFGAMSLARLGLRLSILIAAGMLLSLVFGTSRLVRTAETK